MTKDKWAKAQNFAHNNKNKPKPKFSHPDIPDQIKAHLTEDNILELSKNMLRFEVTMQATNIACDLISMEIYKQQQITIYDGLQHNNPIVINELKKFYKEHSEFVNKKSLPNEKHVLNFESFDDFYDELKNYTQKLNDSIDDEFHDKQVFTTILDDIFTNQTTDSYFIELLSFHIIHEHYHKHILKEYQQPVLSCGHSLPIGMDVKTIQFCPTCGKKQ